MLNDLYLSLGKKGVAKNGGVLSNKTINKLLSFSIYRVYVCLQFSY